MIDVAAECLRARRGMLLRPAQRGSLLGRAQRDLLLQSTLTPEGLDRRRPFIDFALDEVSEILRRRLIVRHDLGAEAFEPIAHGGGMHRLQRGIM
jgi:hypothetical protein